MLIIEYLKSSIELLVNLKDSEEVDLLEVGSSTGNNHQSQYQQQLKSAKVKSDRMSSISGSLKCNSRITVEQNNTNDICIGLMNDFDSQKSTGLTPLMESQSNESKVIASDKAVKLYEDMI